MKSTGISQPNSDFEFVINLEAAKTIVEFITLLGAAVAWPLSAAAQFASPSTQATTVTPQIEVVRKW